MDRACTGAKPEDYVEGVLARHCECILTVDFFTVENLDGKRAEALPAPFLRWPVDAEDADRRHCAWCKWMVDELDRQQRD
ncbi:MAG TPA: hypothetical protein VLJ11_00965 [Bryobacteraceae bacterium]|nr:hypothetical protein [Bryobacteraceae bacterium]